MRKKIEGLRTLGEYIGTLGSIIVFLEENEQHGDDYTDEKKCLSDILVDYEYTLNRANAENPTIDNVWELQSEKKELEREVERLRLTIKNVADFPKRCPPQLKLGGVIDAMACMLQESIE